MQPATLKVLSGSRLFGAQFGARCQNLLIMRPALTCEDSIMRRLIFSLLLLAAAGSLAAQTASDQLSDLPKPHNYVLKRSSSYDRTGGNADAVLCRQEAQ